MSALTDYDYISYENYLQFSETRDGKTEYFDGEIVCMSPTHPKHNRVITELYFQLRNILSKPSKCKIYVSEVAVLFQEEDKKYQLEPDVMVLCDDNFKGAVYTGIPNLVIEVLSKATESRDKGFKLSLYEKFNISEYWIVDINSKEIVVYSNNVNGQYKQITRYSIGMNLTWREKEINIEDVFNS